jgi:hypothetical protein
MIFGTNKTKDVNWYYYLNYRIYSFYRRKKENIPAFFSFLATTTLLMINIQSVIGVYNFFFKILNKETNYKWYVIGLIAGLSVLNYLVLYRNKYYEDVFDDFDKHEQKYTRWNSSVRIYIIMSVVILVGMLIFADLRNHGRI